MAEPAAELAAGNTPEPEAAAADVEAKSIDFPAPDAQQGLLFAACDPEPSAASDSVPSASDQAASTLISLTFAPDEGTIIEPSGFDVSGTASLVETISTADQAAEQLIISLDDAPPAAAPAIAEHADIGRHV